MTAHSHVPPAGPGPDQDQRLEAELAGLKKQFERLRDERLRTERDLDNLDRQLDELRAQARADYGTDDPAELARILEQRRAENQRLVAEYRDHVAGIQRDLDQVEADVRAGRKDPA
ncbi:MAG: hypothetical protein AB7D57_06885 [Desulfovibrionaceae bacterium]